MKVCADQVTITVQAIVRSYGSGGIRQPERTGLISIYSPLGLTAATSKLSSFNIAAFHCEVRGMQTIN